MNLLYERKFFVSSALGLLAIVHVPTQKYWGRQIRHKCQKYVTFD